MMTTSTHNALDSARFDPSALTAARSTQAARNAGARRYVLRLRPAFVVIAVLVTLIAWIVEPADVTWAVASGVVVFAALQLIWVLALRVGVNAERVAGSAIVADGALTYASLWWQVSPAATASVLVITVMVSGFFLSARATFAFGMACAIGIIVAAQTIDHWGPSYALPATAFSVLLMTYMIIRAMAIVRRIEATRERLLEEQADTLETLEQVAGARDRLIANVSHELRTPLTTTIGFLETVLREDIDLTPAQQRVLIQHARDGSLRLMSLVEDLLTFGAIRPDSLALDPEPVALRGLVRDAVESIEWPRDRRVVVERPTAPAHDHIVVRVDARRIVQVITNLLTNALHHGSGVVTISCAEGTDGGATVAVTDEGDGVEPAAVDEMFLPFARFSTRAESTGLGLAICRTIVEAHGGRITYDRTDDERTRFTLELPAAVD